MSHRIEKINELIKRNISEILARELDLKPGVFITLTKVDTTFDLRYSNVFISIYPDSESRYVISAIENELYGIQKNLNKKLHMKPLPKIIIRIDSTESEADVIEKLLKQI